MPLGWRQGNENLVLSDAPLLKRVIRQPQLFGIPSRDAGI